MQLVVTVNKLNKRSAVPVNFTDKNIIGTVDQGFIFNGEEVQNIPNPAIGRWYRDADGSCYWGGGLIVENTPAGTLAQQQKNIIRNNNGAAIINLPAGYILGADISHHNGNPDWDAMIDAGIRYVFIKITEGVGTPDPNCVSNATNARNNGFKIGYYHFCHPDTRTGGTVINDANAEADEAVKRISSALLTPDLPLVLDLENETDWDSPLDKPDYLLWVQTFISRAQNSLGLPPIIYSRKSYLDDKLPSGHNLGNIKLWVAAYSETDCNTVSCPLGWDDWAIWQFRDNAAIGGNAKLDLNILKDKTLF